MVVIYTSVAAEYVHGNKEGNALRNRFRSVVHPPSPSSGQSSQQRGCRKGYKHPWLSRNVRKRRQSRWLSDAVFHLLINYPSTDKRHGRPDSYRLAEAFAIGTSDITINWKRRARRHVKKKLLQKSKST